MHKLVQRIFSQRLAGWLLVLIAATVCAGASSRIAEDDGRVFLHAHTRGELRIGVPTLAATLSADERVRSPERLDDLAAQQLSARLHLPVIVVAVPLDQAAEALAQGRIDVMLADRTDGVDEQIGSAQWVTTDYQTRPKAVIRGDTGVRAWHDVAGRSLCMAETNIPAQQLAVQHGGMVQRYQTPSEALVAVREGRCDIGLIDDAVWAPLLRLPEWRKFAATLPAVGARSALSWLAQPAEALWLQREMRAWDASGVWARLSNQRAREVAFDVYLDQNVPDCHG